MNGSIGIRSPEAPVCPSSLNCDDFWSWNHAANPTSPPAAWASPCANFLSTSRRNTDTVPILAESFSDPQLHEGTIYRASNWTPLGFSKGFKRHQSEFYTYEKFPKKYWVCLLQKNPHQLQSSSSPHPEIFQKGTSEGVAGAHNALYNKHLRSLSETFYLIPDHCSPCSRRYAKIGMFGLIAHGLFVGAPNVKAIWKRCAALSQDQRKAVGLNVRNSSGRLTMPSYDALNNFVNEADPEALAKALNAWLAAHQDKLPKSLALDGKDLGHVLGAIV